MARIDGLGLFGYSTTHCDESRQPTAIGMQAILDESSGFVGQGMVTLDERGEGLSPQNLQIDPGCQLEMPPISVSKFQLLILQTLSCVGRIEWRLDDRELTLEFRSGNGSMPRCRPLHLLCLGKVCCPYQPRTDPKGHNCVPHLMVEAIANRAQSE